MDTAASTSVNALTTNLLSRKRKRRRRRLGSEQILFASGDTVVREFRPKID